MVRPASISQTLWEYAMRAFPLFACGWFVLLTLGHRSPLQAQPYKVQHSVKHFFSGEKKSKVRVEHFEPQGIKKGPALLLAPESASFEAVGPVYQGIAKRLAEEGYLVLIVHFFDRTGHNGVDPKRIREQDFLEWIVALRDGVQYARTLPQVEKEQIGLLGFSLGGYLSVALASDEKAAVKAVACYFGGVPDKLWPHLKKLPPMLVVHGALDELVPVREAYALIGFCKAKGLPCEYKIYEKEGHLFKESLTAFVTLKLGEWFLLGKLAHWPPTPRDQSRAVAEAIRHEATVKEAVGIGLKFFNKHLK